jgi:rRNA pseudouridine-1189 N-methylase Emg1 (Nep1/Mra1 family)
MKSPQGPSAHFMGCGELKSTHARNFDAKLNRLTSLLDHRNSMEVYIQTLRFQGLNVTIEVSRLT